MSNITIIDTAEPETCADLALYYARNGTLWLAIWGEFEVDQEGPIAESYVITDVREFRYDNPRARYMSRQLDPSSDPDDPGEWVPIKPAAWTDYMGVLPYGDIDVDADGSDNAVITEQVRYAAGMGAFARQTLDSGQPDETRYVHGDLIRSTVLTSDESGDAATAVAYTAFGEIVGASGPGAPAPVGFPRYQYAGGWDYESDFISLEGPDTSLPLVTLQHVGARWYDPSIGRFVMRDPAGALAGRNCYVYALNCPVVFIDPTGLVTSVFGLGGQVTGGGLHLQFDIGIGVDDHGRCGLVVSWGVGRGWGYGASGGLSHQITSGTLANVEGDGIAAGGSGSIMGVDLGLDVVTSLDGSAAGICYSIGPGIGTPQGHITRTHTEVCGRRHSVAMVMTIPVFGLVLCVIAGRGDRNGQ